MPPSRPRALAIALLLASLLAGTRSLAQGAATPGAAAYDAAYDAAAYAILPRPAVLVPRTGSFTLTTATVVAADAALRPAARRFTRDISAPTGFDLVVTSGARGAARRNAIRLVHDRTLPAEGYTLDVTPASVTVRASSPAGAFYGLESFKQLLPPDIYREAPLAGRRWSARAVHVEDAPRFPWRGSHLDVARHFMPKEFVKKYIDVLARHKMNRFHWHLTDDQGWRIEIRKYPKLVEMGSCREATMIPPYQSDPAKRVFDGKRHCGHYTQDDIREVVAYAAERYVTVVPEIEMPGHAQAVIYAYPHLSSKPDSTPTPGVMQVWGVSEFILNPDSNSVAFMQDVLSETLELFPGPFIHVGGDEAVKPQWKANPQIQQRIRDLGLKDEHEMQSWFIRQMDRFLSARGRRLIGWDEILEGGLAEGATVMSWRGTQGAIAAAKAGHDVVMAPTSHTYFDYFQSRNRATEPHAFGGFIPLDSVYAFEPVPQGLTEAEAKHVLGAQSQLWTEYMPNAKHVEYMAFPRVAALAEVVWTSKARRDRADFGRRLETHLARLDALDVRYRPLDR